MVLAAVVFISTPHLTAQSELKLKSILAIPKIKLKTVRKGAVKGEGMVEIVQCCQSFDGLQIYRPILTIYETEKTATSGLFGRYTQVSDSICQYAFDKSNPRKIVGQELAKVGAKDEFLEPIDRNYASVTQIGIGDSVLSRISTFVRDKTAVAQLRIMLQLSRSINFT